VDTTSHDTILLKMFHNPMRVNGLRLAIPLSSPLSYRWIREDRAFSIFSVGAPVRTYDLALSRGAPRADGMGCVSVDWLEAGSHPIVAANHRDDRPDELGDPIRRSLLGSAGASHEARRIAGYGTDVVQLGYAEVESSENRAANKRDKRRYKSGILHADGKTKAREPTLYGPRPAW
jgi:hypothetical protein